MLIIKAKLLLSVEEPGEPEETQEGPDRRSSNREEGSGQVHADDLLTDGR